MRKGGRVCLFGIPAKGSVLDYDIADLYNSELSIFASYGATETETKKALDIISSHHDDFARLVTDRFPLSKFDDAVASAGTGMKTVITPN